MLKNGHAVKHEFGAGTPLNIQKMMDVMEQKHVDDSPPLLGTFPVVYVRWQDITYHFMEGLEVVNEEGSSQILDAFGSGRKLLDFAQFGLLIRDDKEMVVVLHSMAMIPNRAEFFAIPKGVVLEQVEIGKAKIEIDGNITIL